MTKLHGIGALILAALSLLVVTAAVGEIDASAATSETIFLSLGDRVRLDRAPIGCRVTRLDGHGKQLFVDCRRAGRLAGTYGTYFAKSKVLVVRYVNSRTARVVFEARHREQSKGCG